MRDLSLAERAELERLEREMNYYLRTTLRICPRCGATWHTFHSDTCPDCGEPWINRRVA